MNDTARTYCFELVRQADKDRFSCRALRAGSLLNRI